MLLVEFMFAVLNKTRPKKYTYTIVSGCNCGSDNVYSGDERVALA